MSDNMLKSSISCYMTLQLASSQLAAAASEILVNSRSSFISDCWPAVQICARLYSVSASGSDQPQRLVTAYLKV